MPKAQTMKTVDVSYAGHTVRLANLPEYQKFYRKLASGAWEARTFETLSRNLDRNTVCVDIGAWIGVTPMWSAQLAKSVIAVEPDPKCVRHPESDLPVPRPTLRYLTARSPATVASP